MGTSVNQASPATANWSAVWQAYLLDAIPVSRAAQELWRAATNQRDTNLATDLSAPVIAQCLSVVLKAATASDAIQTASRLVALSGATSLAADIALRSIPRAFASKDRVAGFTETLFSEASNYFVSRDLPGYVGRSTRTENVSASSRFKTELCREAERKVRAVRRPAGLDTAADSWRTYVTTVVKQLRGEG